MQWRARRIAKSTVPALRAPSTSLARPASYSGRATRRKRMSSATVSTLSLCSSSADDSHTATSRGTRLLTSVSPPSIARYASRARVVSASRRALVTRTAAKPAASSRVCDCAASMGTWRTSGNSSWLGGSDVSDTPALWLSAFATSAMALSSDGTNCAFKASAEGTSWIPIALRGPDSSSLPPAPADAPVADDEPPAVAAAAVDAGANLTNSSYTASWWGARPPSFGRRGSGSDCRRAFWSAVASWYSWPRSRKRRRRATAWASCSSMSPTTLAIAAFSTNAQARSTLSVTTSWTACSTSEPSCCGSAAVTTCRLFWMSALKCEAIELRRGSRLVTIARRPARFCAIMCAPLRRRTSSGSCAKSLRTSSRVEMHAIVHDRSTTGEMISWMARSRAIWMHCLSCGCCWKSRIAGFTKMNGATVAIDVGEIAAMLIEFGWRVGTCEPPTPAALAALLVGERGDAPACAGSANPPSCDASCASLLATAATIGLCGVSPGLRDARGCCWMCLRIVDGVISLMSRLMFLQSTSTSNLRLSLSSGMPHVLCVD
eukprot:Opistho-1_new@4692